MTKDKNNNTEKTSKKRPPKTRHIDVRFTEEHYDLVVHNARLSGRSKSTYLHDLGIGHKPSLPMTAEQEEALKGLIGARSELVYVRNALHALPQTERLKLFKRADFMERWLQGINTLIEELSRIRDKFLDMFDSKSVSNSAWSGNDQLRNQKQSRGHRQDQPSQRGSAADGHVGRDGAASVHVQAEVCQEAHRTDVHPL